MGINNGAKFGPLSTSADVFRAVQSKWKARLEKPRDDGVLSGKQRLPETMHEHPRSWSR